MVRTCGNYMVCTCGNYMVRTCGNYMVRTCDNYMVCTCGDRAHQCDTIRHPYINSSLISQFIANTNAMMHTTRFHDYYAYGHSGYQRTTDILWYVRTMAWYVRTLVAHINATQFVTHISIHHSFLNSQQIQTP